MPITIEPIQKFFLVTSILPKEMINKNFSTQEGINVEKNEQRMRAVAHFLIRLVRESLTAFLKQEPLKFNANPGDHACQLRAIQLRKFSTSKSLHEEAKLLMKAIKKVEQELRKRSSKTQVSPQEFFQRNFQEMEISKDMLFILRSFLLTVTKIKDHSVKDEVGYQFTKTDISRLGTLSKKLELYFGKKERELLIGENARALSKHSIEIIREIASHQEENRESFFMKVISFFRSLLFSNLNGDINNNRDAISPELVKTMLADENIREVKLDEDRPAKFFSCLLFQMNAVMRHLKKENALVAIKHIETKERPAFSIYLRGSKDGFSLVPKEEVSKLDGKIPLIVFLGGVNPSLTQENFTKEVKKVGLENMILVNASQEAPYDRKTSTLEDVKNADALKIINEFREKASAFNLEKENSPFFQFRHIYTDLLEKELA